MSLLDTIANEFNVSSQDLLQDSLNLYLEQRLTKVNSQIYTLSKKYGVSNIFDLDRSIQDGQIHEDISYEDSFLLDNLETEKEKIQHLTRSLE